MMDPKRVQLVAKKHVMRYLNGILDYGIRYAMNSEFRLGGYTDLDWEGSVEDRKRTLGCSFILG